MKFTVITALQLPNKCCSLEFSIHQRIPVHCITVFTKTLSSTTVFNIFYKMFLENRIYIDWFLKGHVTLKFGVTLLKIQLCHHSKTIILKYIKTILTIKTILNCNNISQYYYFYCIFDIARPENSHSIWDGVEHKQTNNHYFWSNNCSFDELETSFKKMQ